MTAKLTLLSFFVFLIFQIGFGQDTLPEIRVTQIGKKVLVSWNNQFGNVTNISIQRSADSLKNFTTIGSVLNVQPGENGYTDTKEFIPSNQYYRLFISFEGGSYLFSRSHRPVPDTSLALLPPAENLAEKEVTPPGKKESNRFVPSSHVYTGRDYNVIISLKDAASKKYSIKFYDDDGTFLFELKKVRQNYLTLDKSNFRHAGLFIFELYEDRLIIERHKFYIPRDGKPMPLLDRDGYELR